LTSDIKNRIALSKARSPLHAADVPREKVKKKLAERENETPHSINGLEKILLSVSSQSSKQYVSAVW